MEIPSGVSFFSDGTSLLSGIFGEGYYHLSFEVNRRTLLDFVRGPLFSSCISSLSSNYRVFIVAASQIFCYANSRLSASGSRHFLAKNAPTH